MVFDWSSLDPRSITWAAFFSDCEHEVLEVTSGHRVTLTYNLFISSSPSGVISGALGKQPSMISDPTTSPLYNKIKTILEDSTFMEKGLQCLFSSVYPAANHNPAGGYMGFHCNHEYAHTSDGLKGSLPYVLKGVDAVIFVTFWHLGFGVNVQPVLDPIREYSDYPLEYEPVDDGCSRDSESLESESEAESESESESELDDDRKNVIDFDIVGDRLHGVSFFEEVPEGERVKEVYIFLAQFSLH